jgi:hypothetical protein
MRNQISFLGHIVSQAGVSPLPCRTESIQNYPTPTSVKSIRRFLGMASFYRRHIPHFAEIALPLDQLTHKRSQFRWTPECQTAFDKLKSAIASSSILQLPDLSKEFVLHVDASGSAIGAVLSQSHHDALLPVAFASRKLTPAETRYSTIDREALALSWGCRHFQHYLYGRHFNVYSDHKPLTGLLTSKSLSSRQYRLLEHLSNFHFTLTHIEGRKNVVADALSRPVAAIHDDISCSLSDAQAADPYCANIRSYLLDSHTELPNLPSYRHFVRHKKEFQISSSHILTFRGLPIIPESLQHHVMEKFHEGHYSGQKMMWRLRNMFWWYKLPSSVDKFVKSCVTCAQSKASGAIRCQSGSLPSPGPYELVFIDIVGPLPSYDKFRYILTMEDSFTKFVRAIPLRSISADSVAAAFYRQWISTFHAPVRLHSDNGTQFSSSFMVSVCQSLGIQQSFSTPYHPEGNGAIERFHRSLKERLRCFPNPDAWPNNIYSATLAYNSTQHSATGSSPFMMAFGFQPSPPGLWSTEYTRGDSPSLLIYVRYGRWSLHLLGWHQGQVANSM